MAARPPPSTPDLSAADRQALCRLRFEYAWSDAELARLENPQGLQSQGLLQRVLTPAGALTVLTPAGRRALGRQGRTHRSRPPTTGRQLEMGYLRLAIQTLGWRAWPANLLTSLDRLGRVEGAYAPDGPALLVARLPGGYSTAGLKRLAERLRGTALAEDFTIIEVTPSLRRGRQFAEDNAAWFRKERFRLAGATTQGPRGGAASPLAAPTRTVKYGHVWAGYQTLSRQARLAAFAQALACDGVLSEAQVERWFSLTRQDVAATPHVDVTVAPVHSRPSFVIEARLYLRSTALRRRAWTTLTHAAGVAELRMRLDVPPDPRVWQAEGVSGRRRDHRPDAVYRGAYGDEAVEYDTGAYTQQTVDRKREAYRDQGYDTVNWGVPSAKRRRRLNAQTDLDVITVRWD